jgi:glycosyltransferase involved in cell wall biosynthesis
MAVEKNLPFLIQSLAPLLRDGSTPVRLMLVGDGQHTAQLQEMMRRLQLEERVLFTGFVENDELAGHYAASDVFVFASRTETQGVCIAEALVAGLPCVVVNSMGAAESVQDGCEGLVVPARAEPFREAVTRLVHDDALRTQMARNARARAGELSLEQRVNELLALYNEARSTTAQPVRAIG